MEISHSDDSEIVSSLSWTAPLQDIEPVTEDTMSEEVFTLPQPHGSFKEYVGNKIDLGRAVIPAAILAGYTGEWYLEAGDLLDKVFIAHADLDSLFLLLCFNRKWSHSAVAVSPRAPHRPQLSVVYKLDRRWMGVQADGP